MNILELLREAGVEVIDGMGPVKIDIDLVTNNNNKSFEESDANTDKEE